MASAVIELLEARQAICPISRAIIQSLNLDQSEPSSPEDGPPPIPSRSRLRKRRQKDRSSKMYSPPQPRGTLGGFWSPAMGTPRSPDTDSRSSVYTTEDDIWDGDSQSITSSVGTEISSPRIPFSTRSSTDDVAIKAVTRRALNVSADGLAEQYQELLASRLSSQSITPRLPLSPSMPDVPAALFSGPSRDAYWDPSEVQYVAKPDPVMEIRIDSTTPTPTPPGRLSPTERSEVLRQIADLKVSQGGVRPVHPLEQAAEFRALQEEQPRASLSSLQSQSSRSSKQSANRSHSRKESTNLGELVPVILGPPLDLHPYSSTAPVSRPRSAQPPSALPLPQQPALQRPRTHSPPSPQNTRIQHPSHHVPSFQQPLATSYNNAPLFRQLSETSSRQSLFSQPTSAPSHGLRKRQGQQSLRAHLKPTPPPAEAATMPQNQPTWTATVQSPAAISDSSSQNQRRWAAIVESPTPISASTTLVNSLSPAAAAAEISQQRFSYSRTPTFLYENLRSVAYQEAPSQANPNLAPPTNALPAELPAEVPIGPPTEQPVELPGDLPIEYPADLPPAKKIDDDDETVQWDELVDVVVEDQEEQVEEAPRSPSPRWEEIRLDSEADVRALQEMLAEEARRRRMCGMGCGVRGKNRTKSEEEMRVLMEAVDRVRHGLGGAGARE